MVLILGAQNLFFHLDEAFGYTTACLILFLILSLFITSFHAIFLPRAIETNHLTMKSAYSTEILGSITGLLLAPLLASYSHEMLLGCYFTTYILLHLTTQTNRVAPVFLVLISILYIFYFETLDRHTATLFYKKWYSVKDVKEVIHTRYTPYHKIEVIRIEKNRNLLVLNGLRQFAHSGHFNYSYFVAEYPARLLGKPEVAVLGCGSMSTVGRIGDIAKSIKIVELDRGVFETSKKYFQDYNRLDKLKNWSLVTDDAKHYLANSTEKFDLILDDIPPARSRQIALTYTKEFFELVKARLTDKGLFSMPSLTPVHSKSRYGKKIIATMASVFDNYFVMDNGDNAYFYGGKSTMDYPSKKELRKLIDHKDKDKIKIYTKKEVDELVKNTEIITINNMADLIYD